MTGPITMIEPAECHLPPSDVEAIEEALAPIADEVWQAEVISASVNEADITVPFGYISFGGARYGREARAAYVIACSPDRMRRILSRLAELMAENERLKADAARYQRLRHGIARTRAGPRAGCIEVFRWDDRSKGTQLKGEALDAAIDAQLAALTPQGADK